MTDLRHEHYILNDDNVAVPVDLMTWAQWFHENHERRIVQRDVLGEEKIVVSTVFLGLDHSWHPGQPREIFETMVFGGVCDQEMARYATWAQAEAGHLIMLSRVRSTMQGWEDA